MPTMADLKLSAIFAMLKGEPGTRKSTQGLSFPLPQYWCSTDQKMNALRVPMRNWGIDKTKVHFDDYSGADVTRGFNMMMSKLEKFRAVCPYKDGTILVDSVTTTGDVINLQTVRLKGLAVREAKEQNIKTDEKDVRKVGGIAVDGFEEYKVENSGFRDLLSVLLDIKTFHNVNIVLIAHVVGERKPEEVGITSHSRIIITGAKSISGKIAVYAEETYHFDVQKDPDPTKESHYKAITRHTGEDFARTMLDLPREIQFDDKKLYEGWIAPAIKKLNE